MNPLEQVKTSLKSGTNMKNGVNGAHELGLEPIGKDSCFACAVGIHKDLPNVVIKIVSASGTDGFLEYAKAIHSGELIGCMFPVIQSITYIDSFAIIVMERLNELLLNDMHKEAEDIGKSLRQDIPLCIQTEDFMTFFKKLNKNEEEYNLDVYPQNWMYRENDYSTELVLLDPLTTNKGLNELDDYHYYYYAE